MTERKTHKQKRNLFARNKDGKSLNQQIIARQQEVSKFATRDRLAAPIEIRLSGKQALKFQHHYFNQHHHTLDEFWQGLWNDSFLVNPNALAKLKKFIHEQLIKNQSLIEQLQSSSLDERELKAKFTKYQISLKTLQTESEHALVFNAWLHICMGKTKYIYPFLDNLKHSSRDAFLKKKLDLTAFAEEIYESGGGLEKNKKTKLWTVNSLLKGLKTKFCKALGATLLNAALEKEGMSFLEAEEFVSAANALLEFGNANEYWDLCLVNSLTIPYHEENLFADPAEWQRALRAEKILDSLDRLYSQNADDRFFIEAMLNISLMRDSFILHERTLNIVLNKLNEPSKLERLGGQIIMRVEIERQFDQEIFISPISEFYLRHYYRLCDALGEKPSLSIVLMKQEFYQRIGLTKKTLKFEGFKSWKHGIKNYLMMKGDCFGMMGALIFKTLESHPLNNSARQRLFKLETLGDASKNVGFSEQNLPGHKRMPRTVLWQNLRNALSVFHIEPMHEQSIRKGIQLSINKMMNSKNILEIERVIFEYAEKSVAKTTVRTPLAPSQVRLHIDAFGLPLIAEVQDQPFIKATGRQRQAFYFGVLNQPKVNRERFLFYLKKFEDWFSAAHKPAKQGGEGTILPDYEELFGDVQKPRFKVDANLITFDEYEQVLSRLTEASRTETNAVRARQFYQSAILLIFGFRLDLRRGEAVFILNQDWLFDPFEPDLFIRPNKSRHLKTKNALRRFHIEEHLSDSERALVENYLKQTNIQFGQMPTYFFFSEIHAGQLPAKIVDPLIDVLKQVSGDTNIKYHNLRHSKASWEMLAILNAQFDLQLEDQFFANHPKTQAFLSHSAGRWAQMVHTPNSLHKAPHLLKKIMGHGSIATTLINYIHLNDLAIAAWQMKIAKKTMTVDWAVKNNLCNKDQLYHFIKETKLTNFQAILEKAHPWAKVKAESLHDSNLIIEGTKEIGVISEPQLEVGQPALNLDWNSLVPQTQLTMLKPYLLHQAFYGTAEQKDTALDRLNVNQQQINNHFARHRKYCFKPLLHVNQQNRLLKVIQNLPSDWIKSILDESFFSADHFEGIHRLLAHFIERLQVKMAQYEADQQFVVDEYNLVCTQFDQAKKIIELCQRAGIQFSFTYSEPKPSDSGMNFTTWCTNLGLVDAGVPPYKILASKVKSPNGLLLITLVNDTNKCSKMVEAYFILVMLESYRVFFSDLR
jgi:hypothetical protein